jgi:transcriptional regulator with XRE-family HTH domain
MVDFGDKLKQLRTLKGLSQEQLANRMSITKSMVSAYENSVRLPSYDVLIKIALFFNTSMDYFFGFDKRKFLDVTELTDVQVSIVSSLVDELRQSKK